jgi:hypothetical protein
MIVDGYAILRQFRPLSIVQARMISRPSEANVMGVDRRRTPRRADPARKTRLRREIDKSRRWR